MMKTLEVIGEAVRNPKYPFRKAEHQPKKARKTATNAEKSRNISIWATGWLKKWPEAGFAQPVQKDASQIRPNLTEEEKSPLAVRADSEKFQFVRHGFEAVPGGDA